MDPTGPSQPGINTAYNTAGNPITHSNQEQSEANHRQAATDGLVTDQRRQGDIPVPSSHQESAVPSSLGYGSRNSSGDKGEAVGPAASNVEGEQMRAPGEGEVYRKQFEKDGFGEQKDLASDLDRKKEEQSAARESIQAQRRKDVDVGGALGDRVGPAAP